MSEAAVESEARAAIHNAAVSDHKVAASDGPGRRDLPAGILPKRELIDRLQTLEQDLRTAKATDLQSVHDLQASIRYWADRTSHVGQLNRYADLLKRAGESAAALDLLQFARAISPAHERTALSLCELFFASGRYLEALQTIAPLACASDAPAQVLVAAARVYHKIGDWERSNQLYERAVQQDPARDWEFLDALLKAGLRERGLNEAERVLARKPDDPRLCYACFAALLRLGAAANTVEQARSLLFDRARGAPDGVLWRARALRLEGNTEAGLQELLAGSEICPELPQLVRERAVFALAAGHWGRDANLIVAARASADAALAQDILQADGLLRACGSSLDEAASNPASAQQVKSPESVFHVVSAGAPGNEAHGDRQGIVMIVPSLAGGGAERIVATSFRRWAKDPRFGRAKLYVSDLDRETQGDFYLPLTGIQRSEIVMLRGDERLEPPWSWLPGTRGRRTQAIYRNLLNDRPAIVHASLDLLGSGLAALAAGVPRIVLHIHNMRPAELGAKDADRMRDCYRTLLGRPEVSLVGCAKACVNDYAEWLGLADTSNLYTVHNGLELGPILASSNPETRAEQRAILGIGPDDVVVGTAFRFAELKRPFLWVDAAERVLSKSKQPCRFVMFGDGELREPVQEYIRGRGLAHAFILPGRVKDIHRRLPIMDVFVLSSRTEALPNALLEAQAAGLPVIAFDVGGVREAMLEGITGRLVRADGAENLADEVLTALSAPEWRRNAAVAGPMFVRRNFSMDRMVDDLSSILLGPGGTATGGAGVVPEQHSAASSPH